ncbi:MAG: hypothetical protein NTV43_03725 [Methylococcales bacterium]|nr:hypothetical protein [Methylococcales bacterium]
MDTTPYTNLPQTKHWKVLFPETLLSFHGTVLAVVLLAMCLLR